MIPIIRVEFDSPTSGAYIHEMTNELLVDLGEHRLRIFQDGESVNFDMTYADKNVIRLESIQIDQD